MIHPYLEYALETMGEELSKDWVIRCINIMFE